ncbi:MAG: zf-HC2 domain-containing protein [Anaerolineales bacterium]
MNHLSDFQLNEYLDNILDPSARRVVEAHLINCSECRARLEELQSVFSTLKSLTDVKLSQDLSIDIASRLPKRSEPTLTPIFAAQLGAALGALFFIIFELAPAVRLPPASAFQSLIPEIRFAIPTFQLFTLESLFPYSLFSLPQLPTFHFPLSSFQISVIAIFTLLLWLIGNTILLYDHSEVQK